MSAADLGGEDRVLAWLRSRYRLPALGDDAALLRLRGPQAVTTDSQIEGIHFPLGLDPALFAQRLLAVNLSDLAAMGADPRFAFLALATKEGFEHRRFFTALVEACLRSGVELAGGDLAHDPSRNHAVLTLIGTRPPRGRWLRRDGARVGHRLWLGGTVGESAAGQRIAALAGHEAATRPAARGRLGLRLPPQMSGASAGVRSAARNALRRHLLPQAQLELGRWLGTRRTGAALDISDGLARDLHRLCRASSCGATLDAGSIPKSPRFGLLCAALGCDPLELVLSGGEDYVLLFTLPAGVAPPSRLGCHEIGRIEPGSQVRLSLEGRISPLPLSGWDHLAADAPKAARR